MCVCVWFFVLFYISVTFPRTWAPDESITLLPQYLPLTLVIWRAKISLYISMYWVFTLLSCFTALDLFPSGRQLLWGQTWVSTNIFRKAIKLYFETLSLVPLLHSLLLLRFFKHVDHIQPPPLSSINLSFLVTFGLRFLGIVQLPLFHCFFSARLPITEAGGISEPPWLCFWQGA